MADGGHGREGGPGERAGGTPDGGVPASGRSLEEADARERLARGPQTTTVRKRAQRRWGGLLQIPFGLFFVVIGASLFAGFRSMSDTQRSFGLDPIRGDLVEWMPLLFVAVGLGTAAMGVWRSITGLAGRLQTTADGRLRLRTLPGRTVEANLTALERVSGEEGPVLDQSSNPRRTVRLTVRDRAGGQVVFVPAQWRDVRAVLDTLHLRAEGVSALVDREAARVLDPVEGGDGSTPVPELYRPPSRSSGAGSSRIGSRHF